jgi:hypothetical protein
MARLMARLERAERRALPNLAVHVVSVPVAQCHDKAVILNDETEREVDLIAGAAWLDRLAFPAPRSAARPALQRRRVWPACRVWRLLLGGSAQGCRSAHWSGAGNR